MKRLSILLWWLGLVFLVFGAPQIFFAVVLVLVLGSPVVHALSGRREELGSSIDNGFQRYSIFMTGARLAITKAALYSGLLKPSNIARRRP